MPRKAKAVPAYLLHAASGQARVRVDGRDFYLGKYDSPESKARYAKLLAEHASSNGASQPKIVRQHDPLPLTISGLVLEYDDFARSFYVRDGERTDERIPTRDCTSECWVTSKCSVLLLHRSSSCWWPGPKKKPELPGLPATARRAGGPLHGRPGKRPRQLVGAGRSDRGRGFCPPFL